ncbi:hypothetical protein J4474_04370 [Candidatus Pacearchaeota archaeon]|nr:hypothetical protein [Candidatus Pacearchaeota archaeon]
MTNKNLKKAEKTLYTKNFEKVVEVSLREFAITSSLDSKPILATYGIGPCVSFSGWSPRHKIGFMTHYDARTRMADSFGNLLSNLSEILQGESTQFKVRIIGGYAISESYNIISFLESRLGSRKDLAMTLVEKDIFGDRVESKSVALDTKTGRV